MPIYMKKAVVYIHGKDGSAEEARRFKSLFPDADVIGFDYQSKTPWEAKVEFSAFFDALRHQYETVWIVANSIGAYFAMHALDKKRIGKSFFISPVVDMVSLIKTLMSWANVTETQLREQKKIVTSFGETLDWDYWTYVNAHPIAWNTPTAILYGEKDSLVRYEDVRLFSERFGVTVTIMPGGEHWFHTDEQMAFLESWIKKEQI